jgi:hypothetical protein
MENPDSAGIQTICKVRGITLNYKNGLSINFNTVRDMVTNGLSINFNTVRDNFVRIVIWTRCHNDTSSVRSPR